MWTDLSCCCGSGSRQSSLKTRWRRFPSQALTPFITAFISAACRRRFSVMTLCSWPAGDVSVSSWSPGYLCHVSQNAAWGPAAALYNRATWQAVLLLAGRHTLGDVGMDLFVQARRQQVLSLHHVQWCRTGPRPAAVCREAHLGRHPRRRRLGPAGASGSPTAAAAAAGGPSTPGRPSAALPGPAAVPGSAGRRPAGCVHVLAPGSVAPAGALEQPHALQNKCRLGRTVLSSGLSCRIWSGWHSATQAAAHLGYTSSAYRTGRLRTVAMPQEVDAVQQPSG